MSDQLAPHLSGWCSTWGRPDQFHDNCRSERCECPNHQPREDD